MERVVAIIDNLTARMVARHTVHLEGLNYTPSDQEYYDAAWQAAVEDGEVKAADRDRYIFVFTVKQ